MPDILITDDEKEIVRLLKIYLETDGITVLEANDGAQALETIERHDIDLAPVDIMMPKSDGYTVIKKIRQREKYNPVMMISAKITLSDRELGIVLGADDNITKPFEPLEVAAKGRAQLRRLNASTLRHNPKSTITVGDMHLNLDECTFEHNGEVTGLTKAEFKVLELLMSQPKRVFTKEQIHESAWYDSGAVDDKTIHVIISRLRDKVGAAHIKTIPHCKRGAFFCLLLICC